MTTEHHTKQAWRIVCDPHATEKQWLAACTTLGPNAKQESELPALHPSLSTAGWLLVAITGGIGAFLCSGFWCYLLINSLGMYQWNSGGPLFKALVTGIMPAAAAYTYGWFERSGSAVSKAAVLLIPVSLFTWMLCTQTTGDWLGTIMCGVVMLLSTVGAFSAAQLIRQSFAKFANYFNIGLPGFASLSVWAIWLWLEVTNTTHFGQLIDFTQPVSAAIIALALCLNTSAVAAAGANTCNTRRWQTSVGAAIAANLVLVAAFLGGLVGCVVFGLPAALTGHGWWTLSSAICLCAAAIAVIALSAGTGYLCWLNKQNRALQPAQDEPLLQPPLSLPDERQAS
jgi:hypothetical protein